MLLHFGFWVFPLSFWLNSPWPNAGMGLCIHLIIRKGPEAGMRSFLLLRAPALHGSGLVGCLDSQHLSILLYCNRRHVVV